MKTLLFALAACCPLATVCAAIQDFAGYPQFMPNVDKIKVTPAGGGASCSLAWKRVPMEGVKVEDTIADTSGYWQLLPDPLDAGAAAVKYQVYTDSGPVPMGLDWIVDSMSRDSIPKMFDALRLRVAARK
ncbi:hypothetical protein CSZ94_23805 [Janthinobacterium sp. ROICE36]|uniref:hypothetical protein n=1 Tax=Janthinobacterium sp. ROICE36 TaxID=2048670 RepID=UPI000C7E90B9|nr:hypothetical protein [Janthinobacterium sp. ROICE36]PLY39901.1 hypothetical protein CSZ94_23805 [Janthinobacterium sp. ROICE36]